MPFPALPPELLELIGQDLYTTFSRELEVPDAWWDKGTRCPSRVTLRNLVTCSRFFYNVFTPYLYRKVEIRTVKQIIRLMYSFMYRPTTAKRVRSLIVRSMWSTSRESNPTIPRDEDFEVMHDAVARVSIDEQDKNKWLNGAESGVLGAWLGLFLPRLSGLEAIKIEYSEIVGIQAFTLLQEMLVRAATGVKPFDEMPAFPHLSHVELTGGEVGYVDCAAAIPFFHFPAMKKICARDVIDSREPLFISHGLGYPQGTSSVVELEVHNWNDADGFEHWISACRTLKNCRISSGKDLTYGGPYEARAFFEKLSVMEHTLQKVCIDWVNGRSIKDWDEKIGSFSKFNALKSLHLSNDFAPGEHFTQSREDGPRKGGFAHCLPPSLEELIICEWSAANDMDLFKEGLRAFLDYKATITPNLRKITLYNDPDEHKWTFNEPAEEIARLVILREKRYAAAEDIRVTYASVGIDFCWIDGPCPETDNEA